MRITALCLALVLVSATSVEAEQYTIEINKQNAIDLMPVLCASLRASLPEAQRNPWNRSLCLARFTLNAMKVEHLQTILSAQRLKTREALKGGQDDFIDTPSLGIGL